MFNASTFYLPIFSTGIPFGKVYTYDSETGDLLNTFKDIENNLNTNPILLDKNGDCVIFISDDKTYRYKITDSNNNVIYELDNITPAKGEPGTPGGPKGPDGDIGRTGPQGKSGGQGPTGETGNKGALGLPLLTKIEAVNNNTYTVPAGISEIFVTACAGGGSAGTWSPYTAVFGQKDPLNRVYQERISVQIGPNFDATNSMNTYDYPSYFISAINLSPGSGFAGQSVFRYRLKFTDSTIQNTVQFIIGDGGAKNLDISNKLDGNDGGDTKVYINGVLKLTLKGGLAGKNAFPANASQVTTFMENWSGSINYNQGYKSNLVYRSSYNGFSSPGNAFPQGYSDDYYSLYSYTTKYYVQNGSNFELTPVKTSYKIMRFNFEKNNLAYTKLLNKFKNIKGENGIFGSYYTNFGDNKENTVNSFYNTVKSVNNGQGYGSGGDAYFSYFKGNTGSQDMTGNMNIRFFNTSIDRDFVFYDIDYIKNIVRNFHLNFRVYNSYNTGTFDIPAVDDTSGYWDKVNNIANQLKNNTNYYLVNQKPTMINLNDMYNIQTMNATYGGAGTNGFAYFEYGSITEIEGSS